MKLHRTRIIDGHGIADAFMTLWKRDYPDLYLDDTCKRLAHIFARRLQAAYKERPITVSTPLDGNITHAPLSRLQAVLKWLNDDVEL